MPLFLLTPSPVLTFLVVISMRLVFPSIIYCPHASPPYIHHTPTPVWLFFFFNFLVVLGLRCCVQAFSSCSYSSLWCMGFSLQWLLLWPSMSCRSQGFSSFSTQAQLLWGTGLVASWPMESSQIRDQTCVPSISRQTLIHCTTREVLSFSLKELG